MFALEIYKSVKFLMKTLRLNDTTFIMTSQTSHCNVTGKNSEFTLVAFILVALPFYFEPTLKI